MANSVQWLEERLEEWDCFTSACLPQAGSQ